MTHTKGPWTFRWETDEQDWAIVLDINHSIVASVNTETGPDATSAPATRKMPATDNARLIAAAPDLLDACKCSLSFLRTVRDEYPALWDQIVDISAVTAWDELKAAIAKGEA
jgi:hypothetical protein